MKQRLRIVGAFLREMLSYRRTQFWIAALTVAVTFAVVTSHKTDVRFHRFQTGLCSALEQGDKGQEYNVRLLRLQASRATARSKIDDTLGLHTAAQGDRDYAHLLTTFADQIANGLQGGHGSIGCGG